MDDTRRERFGELVAPDLRPQGVADVRWARRGRFPTSLVDAIEADRPVGPRSADGG